MDDELEPKDIEDTEDDLDDDADDILAPGKKKSKKPAEDDSIEAMADEEDELLPEDHFDDVEPEDLW